MRGRDLRAGATSVRRLSGPSWRDPRLLVGLALVLASVVLGARVVGAAQDTVGVYALSRDVGAGLSVTADDLRVVQVHLDTTTSDLYLPASTTIGQDLLALRGLAEGELLPWASLGRVGDLTARPVTVPVDGNVPQGVAVGALVDVWVVRAQDAAGLAGTEGAAASEPARLVEAAEVSAVLTGAGALSSRSGADVQVLVPTGALPAVLQAVSDDDDIVLVPVPGASGGARGPTS